MKVIGITGGVGAGKSQVLSFIEQNYKSRIILADNVAHDLEKPGQACYEKLIQLLGTEILNEDATGKCHHPSCCEAVYHRADCVGEKEK